MQVSSRSSWSYGIGVMAAICGFAARAEGQICPIYAPAAGLAIAPVPTVGTPYTAGYAPAAIEWGYVADAGMTCAPAINTQPVACSAVCAPACQSTANAATPAENQTTQKPLDDTNKDQANQNQAIHDNDSKPDPKPADPKPADPKPAEPDPKSETPQEPNLDPVFIDPDADRTAPDADRQNRQTARTARLLPVPPRPAQIVVSSLRSTRWIAIPVQRQSAASSDWRPARD
jgi:hypothetical protein